MPQWYFHSTALCLWWSHGESATDPGQGTGDWTSCRLHCWSRKIVTTFAHFQFGCSAVTRFWLLGTILENPRSPHQRYHRRNGARLSPHQDDGRGHKEYKLIPRTRFYGAMWRWADSHVHLYLHIGMCMDVIRVRARASGRLQEVDIRMPTNSKVNRYKSGQLLV